MKFKYLLPVMMCCLILISVYSITQAHIFTYNSNIEIYFSPEEKVTNVILDRIQHAKKSICVLAYSFTSKPISDALIHAYKNGIDVKIIIDGGQTDANRTYADDCALSGIPTRLDTKYTIAHDKVMIFDEEIVLTGSFNFTNAAEYRNSENVVILYNKEIAKLYIDRFNYRLTHTRPY